MKKCLHAYTVSDNNEPSLAFQLLFSVEPLMTGEFTYEGAAGTESASMAASYWPFSCIHRTAAHCIDSRPSQAPG